MITVIKVFVKYKILTRKDHFKVHVHLQPPSISVFDIKPLKDVERGSTRRPSLKG